MASVIVPVYKAEHFLAKCIESILDQTYGNLELILVDDGSPDGSGRICDEYAAKDGRVRVLHTDHRGVSHARNRGLDRATGEYLFFVDSDDWLSPDYIQNLRPQPGEDLVHGGYVSVVDGKEEGAFSCKAHVTEYAQWRQNWYENWTRGPLMALWANSYRRDIVETNHIRFRTDLDISEDEIFNVEYLTHCSRVRYTEHCDYFYTMYKGGSLMNRHHLCRTISLMNVAQAKERLLGKAEYPIRWYEWHLAIAHHRKWCKRSKGKKRREIRRCLHQCYHNGYFRESIPYMRKYGTLDEKVETFFMNCFFHPMYPGFYKLLVSFSRLKRR